MTYYTQGLGAFDVSIFNSIMGLVSTGVKGGMELYGQYQQLEEAEKQTTDILKLRQLQLQALELKEKALALAAGETQTRKERLQKATKYVAVAGSAVALGLLLFTQ